MKAPPRPDLRDPDPERREEAPRPAFPSSPAPSTAAPRFQPVPQFRDEPGPVVVKWTEPSVPLSSIPAAPPMPHQPIDPDDGIGFPRTPAGGPSPAIARPGTSFEALRARYEVPVSIPGRPAAPSSQPPIGPPAAGIRAFEAPPGPVGVQTLTRPPATTRTFQPAHGAPARPDARPSTPRTASPARASRPATEPQPPRAFDNWHQEPAPPKPARAPSRAERVTRGQALLALGAIFVVLAGSVASGLLGPGSLSKRFHSVRSTSVGQPPPSPLPVFHGPSHLVILGIRAEPDPFVALIGSRGERPPLAVDIPAQAVLTMPGSGSGTVSDAASGDLGTLSISVANTLGTLPEHGALMPLSGLARAVDAAHGIPVSLLAVETLGGRNVGPGTVRLSGQQVSDYLSINRGFDRSDRWRAVLRGLLAGGITLTSDDVTSTDSLQAMNQAIAAARDAYTRELPAKESEGGLLLPEGDQIRMMLAGAFGIHVPRPVPVVVLNGSGAPGVGANVAEKLVPGGFQVVASQNARKFTHKTTTVYANTQASYPAAERAGRLLGVGAVTLGSSPVSGLADITIVVGKDF